MSTIQDDIELAREAVNRQPGCPLPDCNACRRRQERIDAFERVAAAALTPRAELTGEERAVLEAESERDTALARVKELEARIDGEFTHDQLLHEVSSYRSGMMAAESALASARSLLGRAHQFGIAHPAIRRDVGVFLSSAPSPAAGGSAEPCSGCAAARELADEIEQEAMRTGAGDVNGVDVAARLREVLR